MTWETCDLSDISSEWREDMNCCCCCCFVIVVLLLLFCCCYFVITTVVVLLLLFSCCCCSCCCCFVVVVFMLFCCCCSIFAILDQRPKTIWSCCHFTQLRPRIHDNYCLQIKSAGHHSRFLRCLYISNQTPPIALEFSCPYIWECKKQALTSQNNAKVVRMDISFRKYFCMILGRARYMQVWLSTPVLSCAVFCNQV